MRNADATRERILEAALAEFSSHGIAGARVDRIAAAAGCNKNLIYIYFENKESLFATVLRRHLARVFDEHPFTPDDLPGYAARVFDFAMVHPDLMRLLAWFNLEQTAEDPHRLALHRDKLAGLVRAQEAGRTDGALSPAFILTAVMALATAWSASSPFGMIPPPMDEATRTRLRGDLLEAIRRLTGVD